MEITILGRHKPLGYDCSNRTAPDSSAPDLRTPKSYNFSTSGGDTPLSDSSGTHAPQFQLYPPVSDGIVVDLLKNQAGLGEKEDCFIGYDTSTRGNPTGYDVELVITKYKVVWSQGLVLRKALDFSSEKDPVVQAFFSWFLVDSNTGNPTTDLAGPSIDPENNNHSGTKQHQSKPMADRCRRARRQALVVLFERNIKLFFHNGDTYLVHAPFACRRAWAMDLGLILERAVQKDEYGQAAYGIGLEVFYSLLDPLIEFRPVALEPARNAKETRATSSGPNRMMNESTHIRNVEIHNTIKFVSTDDKYIRIAITFDSNLLLHRVWRYFMNTNLDPLPLEIEETGSLADVDAEEQMMDDTRNDAPKMRRDIYFQEIKSLITSSSQESTVFIAHKMDGACVVCILDHEVGKLTCYELVKNTLAPLWVVLVSAASAVQATRKNQLDVLLSTPDHKLLLWTGFAGEFVPCHLNIHKALTHVSGDKKLGDDIRVVEIGDNVEDRVSFKLSNSMVLRARLDFMIRSSLVQQCLDALCFVLPLDLLWSFRHRFLQLHFSKDHRYADEPSMDEWGHFRTTLLSYCVQIPTTTVSSSKKFSRTRSPIPGEVSDGESDTEFLLESAIHSKLSNHPSFRRNPVSLPQPSKNPYREAIDRAQRHAALLSGGPVTRQAARIDPYICRILVALHLVHEDRSINVITAEERHLAQLLTLLSHIVRWHTWVDLYSRRSFACTLRFDLPGYEGICAVTSPQPDQFEFDPPDILDWITKVVSLDNTLKPFPTLRSLCLDRRPHIPSLFTKPCDQTRKVIKFFTALIRPTDGDQCAVRAMVSEGFSEMHLDQLPFGVSLPLREAIWKCRRNPAPDLGPAALSLVGRPDLAELSQDRNHQSLQSYGNIKPQLTPRGHNEPTSRQDIHKLSEEGGTEERDDEQELTGAEITDSDITDLRFGTDTRIAETQRMLQSSMILKIGVKDEGEISAEDLKATHQEILRKAAQRTLALPAGRAILTFGTATALPTQRWSIPSIILSAKLMPAYGMTELEMAVLGDEEYMNWPRFHNGVAAGLRISPNSKGVNSSWINYNRPEVPTNEHAGFLLALGLTGHLRMLERSSVVEYLTKTKHDMTRIGLLLGLAGSFCGTMDSRVNKILSLYVIAFMTPDINLSTIDLNLSTTTEIAGILGIGLNYMETAHRQKAEVMLREIGRVTADSTDSVNDLQECYSLAAGFALGFITLGQGVKATELRDLKIESVLTSYMHGNKDGAIQGGLSTGSSQIGGADEPNRRQTGNDMTSAGATIALALMYLKTNSKTIAEKLNVPETLFLLEYVTPDALILRVICRSLVLWDSIEPTNEWIQSQLPNCLKSPTEGPPVSEAAQQWYYAILAGSCFAMGLRFAGSGNEYAYECILSLFDMFFDLGRQSGDGSYEAAITISTVKTCMDVASLAAAMVVAGSGRVDFLRRMRKLHKRIKGDTTYGSHLASHMAMGLLFLGGGGYTLGTSNRCVASLLCSLYPRLPFDATDNRYHLQAFRHLWVMAVEPRCLVTRDVNTGVCCPVPVRVHLKPDFCHTRNQLEMSRRSSNAFSILPLPVPATADDSMISSRHGETPVYYPTSPLEMMTPCLLPELTAISTIEILGPRYWPITLDLGKVSDRNKISLILQSRTIPVMRHIGHLSYTDDPMGMRSILARPFPKVLTDEDFAILARDRTSDGGARRRKRARMDLISANSRLLKQLRRKHTPSPTSDARSLMLSGDWEEETEQVDQISASFGEDFSLTFLQDPQVGAFASYLCRIHGGTTMMAKDEVMAVYFTHVLNECLTMDKVDALGPHIWLYEISNRLDSYDELSWRTLRELRILLKYYETQRKRRIGHNSTHTQGGSTGIGSPTLGGDLHPGTGHVGRTTRRPSVSATAPTMSSMAKVLEDDGSETLVKVSRIAEMYSKIEKRVNQFLAKGQDLTTLSQEVDGNESQEEGNVGITFEDVTMYFVNGTFPNIDSGQSLSRIPIGIKALRGTFGTRKRVGTDWFKAWLEVNEIPGPDVIQALRRAMLKTQAAWAPHVYNPDRTTRSSVMAANRPVSTDTTPSGTASSVASGSGTSSVLSTPPPPLPGSSKQDPESYLLQQVFSVAFPTLNLAVLDYVLASIEEEL